MSNSNNVYQRILRVRAAVGAAPKTGKATYGSSFSFHKIDDVMEHLDEGLRAEGLVITQSVKSWSAKRRDQTRVDKGGHEKEVSTTVAHVTTAVSIVNADDPKDMLVVDSAGSGFDDSDKAVGKALAYALKNALLVVFSLRGQPDPEDEDLSGRAVRSSGARRSESSGAAMSAADHEVFVRIKALVGDNPRVVAMAREVAREMLVSSLADLRGGELATAERKLEKRIEEGAK